MKITSVALPVELTDKIDRVARDSERSRSYIVRKLLETALSAAARQCALNAIAAHELEGANSPRERRPNPGTLIADSCAEGRARLDALQEIANGSLGKTP